MTLNIILNLVQVATNYLLGGVSNPDLYLSSSCTSRPSDIVGGVSNPDIVRWVSNPDLYLSSSCTSRPSDIVGGVSNPDLMSIYSNMVKHRNKSTNIMGDCRLSSHNSLRLFPFTGPIGSLTVLTKCPINSKIYYNNNSFKTD